MITNLISLKSNELIVMAQHLSTGIYRFALMMPGKSECQSLIVQATRQQFAGRRILS
jgi:hypothetical protein